MEQETDYSESLNQESEDTTTYEVSEGEDEVAKAKEYAKNQKIRAEKAEAELKQLKLAQETKTPKKEEPPKEETPKEEFSLKDYKALSDVPDEDVDDVIEFARFKKISISEAKNNPIMQNLLRDKAEKRQTALVTNTGDTRRGVSKTSADDLLRRFEETGEVPESDEDMRKLAEARIEQKRRASKTLRR